MVAIVGILYFYRRISVYDIEGMALGLSTKMTEISRKNIFNLMKFFHKPAFFPLVPRFAMKYIYVCL